MIRCRSCRKATGLPFKVLAHRHRVRSTDAISVVALRLKCRGCRARVEYLADVVLWRVSDGQPP